MYPPSEYQKGLPEQLSRTSSLGPHPWHLLQGLPLAQLGSQLLHVLHHVAHVPAGTRNASDSGPIVLPENCQLKFCAQSNPGNFSEERTKNNVRDDSYPDKSGE